jgi:hypothetical protein
MNLLRKLRYIPTFLPDTWTYANNIAAAGASISSESLQAIDRFVRDCYNASIWTKLNEVYPLAGNNLTAALIRLKSTSPNPSLQAVNFVSGDYTERGANGGLLGDGATKYLNNNMGQSVVLPANGHLSCYLKNPDPAGIHYFIAGNTATDWSSLGTTTGTDQRTLLGGSAVAANLPANAPGFIYADRSSPTDLELQANNGAPNVSTTSATPAYSAGVSIYMAARSNNSAATQYSAARFCFFSIGASMTAAERTAFYNAVVALQTNLGRNV